MDHTLSKLFNIKGIFPNANVIKSSCAGREPGGAAPLIKVELFPAGRRYGEVKQLLVNTTTSSTQKRLEFYHNWLECKCQQDTARRVVEIIRKFRIEKEIKEELKNREKVKEEKLTEWIRKKEEEIKAMNTHEERKAAQQALEEERRRVRAERAYKEWLRSSNNKSRMFGSIFINPVPWQSTIAYDEAVEENIP